MIFFFFNDTATTEIYTLSLHDALPIYGDGARARAHDEAGGRAAAHRPGRESAARTGDRKSTRLNSSHLVISYAVFCLKKKNLRARKPGVLALIVRRERTAGTVARDGCS